MWNPQFYPSYTPKEMLEMGVFEGKYLNAIKDQFPKEWFVNAKLSDTPNPLINFYGVKSRKPLSHWQDNGWILEHDQLGWFQWYCNYYLGRRTSDDQKQINRWRSFVARHSAQVMKHCKVYDESEPNGLARSKRERPIQKQALLQWGWKWSDPWNDSRIINKNILHIDK